MSKMDVYTYLRGLGYTGTVSQMSVAYRRDTTRWRDDYAETAIPTVVQEFTYNSDGSLATVKENGIPVSVTYNADGTIATDVRDGVTRVWVYSSGKLVSVTAV